MISGSHPGYITEDQFEANQNRLLENRSQYGWMRRRGSPREGSSLLQGIVLCGRCGRNLLVRYPTVASVSYQCRHSRTQRLCQEVNGRHVDPLIERVVLESVTREELELAVGALEKLVERSRELNGQWHKRIEAARYEASRAARRYHQVEPENRLVARTLEREWNEHLEEVECLETRYEEMRRRPPLEITDDQRRKILELANDLPRLFREPTTQNSQRKQIVRLLIEDVTLRNVDVPCGIDVAIRWRTGTVTHHTAQRPERHPWTTRPEAVERMEQLLSEKDDGEIAEILNAEGHRTGYGQEFTAGRVASLRLRRGLSRLRRTSSEVIERIERLTDDHTDLEIATFLNQEGLRTASGRPFTDSIVRHIRHRQRQVERRSEQPEED